MVLICWVLAGERCQRTVPTHEARSCRQWLESRGAVVYWTERLANPQSHC